jgi:hypothetical protein
MGYRSDVKYVICLPDDKAIANYMGEVNLLLADKPDMKDVLDKITNSVEIEPAETGYTPKYKYQIRVHWEWVKWYEGYDWVESQERLMELALDYDGAWFFIRLGESDDDCEVKSDSQYQDEFVEDYITFTRSSSFA